MVILDHHVAEVVASARSGLHIARRIDSGSSRSDPIEISSHFVLQSRTQLTRCWGTVPSSFPSLPRVASSGTEAWRTPFRGLPHLAN